MAVTVSLFLLGGSSNLRAQDASHFETATSRDSSDWGLLGLLGLIGLLGLRKRKSPGNVRVSRNP
jgi:MYXO-CTERM domain-containing protein